MRTFLSLALILSSFAAAPLSAKKVKATAQIIPERQRICTMKTESGLGYKVLRKANGPVPTAKDVAILGYVGYFAKTGAVFDSAEKTPMRPNDVVDGFSEGLKMMPKGSIWRFCLPSRLAYGSEGAGPIPPNSDLIFQIQLHDVMSKADFDAARKAARASTQN